MNFRLFLGTGAADMLPDSADFSFYNLVGLQLHHMQGCILDTTATYLEHHYHISVHDGAEPMRDNDGCPLFPEGSHGILDLLLS